jgi:hypothetical protein
MTLTHNIRRSDRRELLSTVITATGQLAPLPLATDLCRCGHKRSAHVGERGRCWMDAWRGHRCSCSLFILKAKR